MLFYSYLFEPKACSTTRPSPPSGRDKAVLALIAPPR